MDVNMSHVFISYSHKDTEQRNALNNYLSERGMPIWYDERLEGGDDWRDEISTAIDEAFVVLLIVTGNAMNSHYCTYEWAYALGTGAPVIPLIFENINFMEVHAPLRNKQFINCTNTIPESLVQRLLNFRQEPIDVIYLKRKMMDAIMPFHILINTLFWISTLPAPVAIQQRKIFHALAMRARDEAAKLHFDTLPELMTDKSHAFTSKLKRSTRLLIDKVQNVYELLQENLDDVIANKKTQENIIQQLDRNIQTELEDLISATVEHSELLAKYTDYLELSKTKRADPFSDMDIHILFGLYLDEKDQETVIKLISRVVNNLYPKSRESS